MNRGKDEILGYLSSQSWYPRFMELMNKYQSSEAYKQSILAGNKREHTLLSAFPFKELSEEEKIEWIERHNEFFFWFRGMRGKRNSVKANGTEQVARRKRRIAMHILRKEQKKTERKTERKAERVEQQRTERKKPIIHEPSMERAQRNLSAAKMYLAKKRLASQNKGHRSAIKPKDDKEYQK